MKKPSKILYFGKKALAFLLSVLVLSLAVFYVSRLAPGDPLVSYYGDRAEKLTPQERAQAEEKLGLDEPIFTQYVRWAQNALRGDFGISYKYKMPAAEVIASRAGNTLLLGGIGFVLEQNYGYNLPPKMREALGYKVKSVSDHSHKELSAGEVLHIFEDTFLNKSKPLSVVEAHFAQVNGITATVTLNLNGQRKVVTSVGNGRLDAVANAIQSATGMDFHLETYSEHSLDEGSTSRAASYVGLEWGDGIVTWGAGTDTDIIVAGIHALVSAINNK